MMTIVVAALLGASYLATHYLWSLPHAPECPACRTVTGQPARTSRLDRLLSASGSVTARHCPRCGWTGRMRWRLATERVPRK